MSRINRRGSPDSPVYQARTGDILVRVAPTYLPEDSNPENGRWIWAYTIEIENHGKDTVTLVSRHWIITDARNRVEEVQGEGVVGEQPVLGPREAFRYASGCPLSTPSGAMRGSYQMVTAKGDAFEVEIPAFSLHLPGARRRLN
ncbi:MAG: Co2+/Mg2+ efflux protein ApaG [Caulobacter sp.]|nr:Co2+/Mg2+ efflux protein ApaG [Caulobacter sp.]